MAWIQCLIWMCMIVVSSSSPDWLNYYTKGSKQFQPQYRASYGQHEFYNFNQDFEWGNQHSSDIQNDNPIQRVNERSISVTSSIQHVQENEKRRVEPKTDDRESLLENGSYKVINDFAKPYPRIQNRNGNEGGIFVQNRDNVVFPGASTKASQYVPQISEECKKTGICEDVPNYPEAYVNKLINQIGETSDKFKMDELLPPDIAQRNGAPDEIELCTYKEKIVTPHAAPDRDGKWHFIVNRKDKPLQGFRVEVCTGDTSCNRDVGNFFAYNAICKQKRMLRHMAALDENGNVVDRPFAMPSCCTCVLQIND